MTPSKFGWAEKQGRGKKRIRGDQGAGGHQASEVASVKSAKSKCNKMLSSNKGIKMSVQSRSIREPAFSSSFYQNVKLLEQIQPFPQDEREPVEPAPSAKDVAKKKLLKLLGRKRMHEEIAKPVSQDSAVGKQQEDFTDGYR